MQSSVRQRLIGIIPVFFGITLVSFFVIHLAPGKPADLQTSLNPKVSFETRERLAKLYGLDKPLVVQYGAWLGRTVRFDFGRSYVDDRPVVEKIAERLPVTVLINLLSLLLILGIGIPLGILAAIRRGTAADRVSSTIGLIAYSMPEFWLALLAISLFGITLRWVPVSGIVSLDYEYLTVAGKVIDVVRHLLLPVAVAAFGGFAGIARYMRSSMVGIINEEYIRTARAKGLPERLVIGRHALRNALLPVITIVGLSVPGLIGGSVIFESVFAIPGMGRLFYDAVMARDYPVIMGILTIGAILTLLGNLLADVAYAYADPRIRTE